MSEKFNPRIPILVFVALAALICAAILLGASCEPEIPEIEIEADFITVGFEDYSTIELIKGSPEFKEVNDEAIRIYQNICDTMECVLGPENVEEMKYNNKFVEIEFIEPPSVTTYSDEGEVYKTLDSPSVTFVFTGEYAGFVLCAPTLPTEWPEWGILGSRRSFRNLEKMVDALRS
jgi:hypothetical protein